MAMRSPVTKQPSRAVSQGSSQSPSSRGKYKKVGDTFVDHSLFSARSDGANNENLKPEQAQSPKAVTERRKSRSHQGNRPSMTYQVKDLDSVVVTSAELEKLKSASVVLTDADRRSMARDAEHQLDLRRAEAKKRRDKIIAMEDERRRQLAKSEFEIESEATKLKQVTVAQALLEENIDEVKEMNKMCLYAKCVTIRDAQVAEKELIKAEQLEEEKRLDLVMELDRLKSIQMYEERDSLRQIERKKGASIITNQIREREKERLKQIELQDIERQEVLKQMERLKKEEIESQNAKKEKGRETLLIAKKFNDDQIARKSRERDDERAEEAKIAEYIRLRDEAESLRTEEDNRLKAEKEVELAKMRAQQQKANDKQAELDALRAKRAHESYEREWRKKEKAAAERQAAIMQDLFSARERQRLEKEQRMYDQSRMERNDYERIILVQKKYEDEEKEKEDIERVRIKQHINGLRQQIERNAVERKQQREEYLDEGKRIRMQQQQERRRIEMIKQKKLEELKASGVPVKYVSELERMKI